MREIFGTKCGEFRSKFLLKKLNLVVKFYKKCSYWGECGEQKYFTEFHSIAYKSSPLKSPQNSPHFVQKLNNEKSGSKDFLKKFTQKPRLGILYFVYR